MAGISVKFRAVDDISSRFDAMVSAGTRALDTFDRLESAADSSYEAISSGSSQAAQSVERAASATDYWTDRIGNYDRNAMQAVWTTEELVEMGYMTEDALQQASDSLDEASNAMENFGEEADKTSDKTEEFGESASNAVLTLDDVLATAGIVMALKEIGEGFIKASDDAARFETSIAKLTTVADASVLSADQLSSQITQLSIDMAQGVNEITDSSYNAISAGVNTANAVEVVENATKLSVAGFTNVGSSLSVLTTALNAYGLEASEITNISDSLVMSQNLGVLTIDQLSSSMGKAISTASAYSVDLYNLESGYISLTKAGISVEESTTYISSMFNELGKSGSGVAKVLQEETGKSFGELMSQGYTLADVLEILYESVDGNAEAMMNLWGSAEAGKAANAIVNQGLETFNKNLVTLKSSAGATEKAYKTMTNTTEFATQRMENSFANLSIAIGDDLNPTVTDFKNRISDMVDGFTKFIDKHPSVTSLLTGIAVGLTTITIGIGGYAAATKIATLATAAWTAVMNMNPVFLAVTAVTALTAAVVTFATVLGDSVDEYDTWTDATRRQYDELRDLEQEYENAVDIYGETSEEALRLKYQVDELSDSFENNKKTLEDFYAECDAVVESSSKMVDNYEEGNRTLHSNELRTQALVQRLEDLSNSTDTSAGKQQEMEAIIAELNETVTGLNLSYGDLIDNQGAALTSLKAYAEMQAKQEKIQKQYQSYVDAIGMEAELREKLAEATEENAAAQERYNTASDKYFDYVVQITKYDTTGMAGLGLLWSKQYKDMDAAQKAYDETSSRVNQLTEQLNNQLNIQKECEEAWDELANSATDASSNLIDQNTAVNEAIAEHRTALEELAASYDAAYESAKGSIEGQYKLWDEVKEVVAMSQSSIEDALQSQLNYWTAYNANLDSLTSRASSIEGLSDLLADLSDGSAESAAMLEGLNNMNDTDLSAVVKQYSDLRAEQDNTAKSIAELETEFSDKLENIGDDMKEMIDGMSMEDGARINAKRTMDAYVDEIEAGIARAQSAIDSISFADQALSSGKLSPKSGPPASARPSITSPNVSEYAVGTESAAPGLALVGEEGPELVRFGGGEVVYTADETSNILSRDNSDSILVPPSESDNGKEVSNGDKTITLKIEGAGEVKVGGSGVSKEEVVALLLENMKGALMSILQTEIMEEGDMAYDF